ncbi:MAG TPA: hypothetical protein HPP80_03405, partial [Rhodospirillaceae bacterium]|nr:hypothetical protein [Rhodospirillaceae bacterium]
MTLLIIGAWLAFRIADHPLGMSFLTPYIEDALTSPDRRLSVKLESTFFGWSEDSRTLEIRTKAVRILDSEQQIIAAVPEMAISLSGAGLLRGVLTPKRLRLYRPSLHLLRDDRGQVQIGMGMVQADTAPSAALNEALTSILQASGDVSALAQLQQIEVLGGDLVIEDLGQNRRWHAPHADVRLSREQGGVAASFGLDLDLDERLAHLSGHGVYRPSQNSLEASLGFDQLDPSLLADFSPQLAPLDILHLALSGELKFLYQLDAKATSGQFELTGSEGVIDASLALGNSWPIKAVVLRGGWTVNSLAIDSFRVDLGGPVVSINGKVETTAENVAIDLGGRIENLPVDDLKGFWPPTVAANPRDWILKNLSQGQITLAYARFKAHLAPGQPLDEIVTDQITGEVVAEGVTVLYLPPMPPVKSVSTRAVFDANEFVLDIKGGEVMDLKVRDGKVILGGLSNPEQFADIKLAVVGPVREALRLIDHKPLGWAHALGLEPDTVKGEAVTQLDLRFPLLQALNLDQMQVHAAVETRHLGLPAVALGLDLVDGALALDISNGGIDAQGQAQLGGRPATIKWRENFGKASFRSRYQLSGSLDEGTRKRIGLESEIFQPPVMKGTVPVEVTATFVEKGKANIAVKADLTPVALRFPGLNQEKEQGKLAKGEVEIRLEAGRLTTIPSFSLSGGDGLDV